MTHERKKHCKSTPTVLSEAEIQLEEFKTKTKAEQLIKEIFPAKVVELTTILDSDKLSMARLSDMHMKLNIPVPHDPLLNNSVTNCESSKKRKLNDEVGDMDIQGTKVYSIPGGVVPVNMHVVEILEIIKPQAIDLINYANQIKMWITFMVPKIEDGNNFGVSIQEDTIAEARQVESEAATYLDQISRYFLTRGKIVSKVAKYPHVDDYRRTVQELDEKEFISLRLVLTELRNHYASLHDIISKNMDKIKKPRNTNTDNMY